MTVVQEQHTGLRHGAIGMADALASTLSNMAPVERHTRHHTAHPSLIAEILDLLAGKRPAPPTGPRPPLEPLSGSEIRVLR